MEQAEEGKRILNNIKLDPCLPAPVESAFFDRLSAKGNPGAPGEAQRMAYSVVAEDLDNFTCQGRHVPEGRVQTLFRMESVSSLRYRTPDILDRMGLTDSSLRRLASEELRTIIDDYEGIVLLGNKLQIVWATDYAMTQDLLDNPKVLIDRLGLAHLAEEAHCIFCAYPRNGGGGVLNVPRALDAIDMPGFQVVPDCSAESGKTRPLTARPEDGLPEVIHRRCQVLPTRWQLSVLQ